MLQTFIKEERLTNKKLFEQLFSEGKQLKYFPFRLVYLPKKLETQMPVQAAITVPKRLIKKAVHRNRIKRQMREAYRKNKHHIYSNIIESYILLISFLDTKEWKSVELDEKMKILIEKFILTINENNKTIP